MQVFIKHKERREVTREANPDDRWDADDLYHEHEYGSHLSSESIDPWGEESLTLEGDLVPGKQYYLLIMSYGTGDSFHHEDNCQEILGVYGSPEIAKQNRDAVREANEIDYSSRRKKSEPIQLTLLTDSGKEYQISNPCYGYFENFTRCWIEPVVGTI